MKNICTESEPLAAATAQGVQKYESPPAAPGGDSNTKPLQIPVLLSNALHAAGDKSIQIPSPTSVASAPSKDSISHHDVISGCHKLLTSPITPNQKTVSIPGRSQMLYVGIIMERPANHNPANPFSWGFSMIKEKCHVHIVGVNRVAHEPVIKFSRVTNQSPSCSIVYDISQLQRNSESYQSHFMKSFPPSWQISTGSSQSLDAPCLQLGDAILSINGVSVTTMGSTSTVATFVRQHCQQKLIIVALRHESVWKAGWQEMTKKIKIFPSITQAKNTELKLQQMQLQNQMREKFAQEQRGRVAKAIKLAWARVQSQRDSQQAKRKIKVQQMPSERAKFDTYTFDRLYELADTRQLTNGAFRDCEGKPIPYCDNNDFNPDDGRRFRQFVTRDVRSSFDDWLKQRKMKWRKSRKGLYLTETGTSFTGQEDESTLVPHDFWLLRGYESFDDWILASKAKWRRSYSWHKKKRMKMQTETEREVHFPSTELIASHGPNQILMDQFNDWLGVRKQQWRITRRRRQLQRGDSTEKNVTCTTNDAASSCKSEGSVVDNAAFDHAKTPQSSPPRRRTSALNDTMIIDELLEDQQCQETQMEIDHSPPLDIGWIFDSEIGCPDDVVVLLMSFLNPSDHGNLLCLSWASNYSFKKRDAVWQSLCPKHWILPRRPRKSW